MNRPGNPGDPLVMPHLNGNEGNIMQRRILCELLNSARNHFGCHGTKQPPVLVSPVWQCPCPIPVRQPEVHRLFAGSATPAVLY